MNQAINFFWTIICFAPICLYWLNAGEITACWYFIGFSFICLLIPSKWLQLSVNPKFYERLGAKFIRKFVQNGNYIKKKIDIITNKTNAQQYAKTILMYEKFHFLCLVFFLLSFIHAVLFKQYLLANFIIISNVVYNVYPMLLQQYNRARLMKMIT